MGNKKYNGWLITGISSIILGIISSAIYDFIKSKPILSSLISFFRIIWNFTIRILESEIKLWLIFIVIFLYKIIKFFIRKYNKGQVPKAPSYFNYTSERFTNWLWKWNWKWNGQEWKISSLYPYCPKCDIELINKSNIIEQKIICPRCKTLYTDYNHNVDDTESVKAMIYDNVTKNRY